LTVLDDLGLVLKLMGTGIHTHTQAKTHQKPAGYPYLCPSLISPVSVPGVEQWGGRRERRGRRLGG